MEREEYLFAQIATCVVNFSLSAPKERVQPYDFMPSQRRTVAAGAAIGEAESDLDARSQAVARQRAAFWEKWAEENPAMEAGDGA